MTQAEYDAARAAHVASAERHRQAQIAYRARKIGDAEYIAARREHEEATKVFDAAYEARAIAAEAEEAAAASGAEVSDQLSLF